MKKSSPQLSPRDHVEIRRVGLESQIKILEETERELGEIVSRELLTPGLCRASNIIRTAVIDLKSALRCVEAVLKSEEV
ncbi:MAG: hypothetical protein PHN44_10230 [Candidatus Marinimicrobia bacterium]|nr:hypothetical protein [Candidatus Neomarinimicrobiota bacterium]